MSRRPLLAVVLVLALAALACNVPIPTPPTPASPDSPTSAADTAVPDAPTEAVAPSATPEPELALYYVANPEGSYQVYRYGADGSSNRMTNAPGDISSYHVNPVDGSIVYVFDNQLFIKPVDGDAYVLLSGGALSDEYYASYYTNQLSDAVWSPDGSRLAYGLNGLHVYTMATGEDQHLLTNQLQDFGEGNIFPDELYFPYEWSPDGSQLLIFIAFIEGGQPAVFDPPTSGLTRLGSGVVCCDAVWGPGSNVVYAASPVLGLVESGLWRFPLPGGAREVLLPSDAGDGTFNFAGWPVELADGSLNFFYANTVGVPEGYVPLTMVNAHPDRIDALFALRPERWDLFEALWKPDGSAAMVVQRPPGDAPSYPQVGPILLVPADGSAATPIGPTGYQLQWGP